MLEFIGIVFAFVVIIIMVNKKLPLGLAMFIASLLVLMSAGVGPRDIARIVWTAALDLDTLDLAFAVAVITALASLLGRYSFFVKMVAALRGLLQNDNLALMIVPGLIGSMPMVGGAIVSAPIVDNMGQRLNLSRKRRSAANIIFRHSWYFIFPFMPNYILASRLAGITVEELLFIQWPLTVVMLIAGYYFILRRAETPGAVGSETGDEKLDESVDLQGAAWQSFIKYSSPILLGLMLYLGLGLNLGLSLLTGIGLTLGLVHFSENNEDLTWSKVPGQLIGGINWEIVGAMVMIMVFRASIDQTVAFETIMNVMLEWGIPLALITAGLGALIGFVSASHASSLAVVLPIVTPMALAAGENVVVYVMLAYCFAFLAYLISPLHLCQILTNNYFDVSLVKVYRVYTPVILSVAATAGIIVALNGLLG